MLSMVFELFRKISIIFRVYILNKNFVKLRYREVIRDDYSRSLKRFVSSSYPGVACLHPLYWLNSQDVKSGSDNTGCCLTQQQTAHIDFDNLT